VALAAGRGRVPLALPVLRAGWEIEMASSDALTLDSLQVIQVIRGHITSY
jgi:hypothetical protein